MHNCSKLSCCLVVVVVLSIVLLALCFRYEISLIVERLLINSLKRVRIKNQKKAMAYKKRKTNVNLPNLPGSSS